MARVTIPALILGSALLGACATSGSHSGDMRGGAAPSAPVRAGAVLYGPDGAVRGTVEAAQMPDGIRFIIRGEGLPPGMHGVHVHGVGKCTPPDFASAGGHWNPLGRQHGRDNPNGMHMGDLPNLNIGADGKGVLEIVMPGERIADGPNPMLDADGAAIVVHAAADDMKTDPSGNSGSRIACGVFSAG